MRPFIPAPGVARLQLIYNYNGAKVENVIHWIADMPFSVNMMENLADLVKGWWIDNFRTAFNPANSLDHIEVQALDEENSPGIVYTDGLPSVGLNVGNENLPGNVTVTVKLGTPYRGRSYRGRIYHVGLTASTVTGNRLTGLYAIALGTAYQTLVGGLGMNLKFKPVIVSYMSHGQWRAQAVVTQVTYQYVGEELDSQRRRLAGRGT